MRRSAAADTDSAAEFESRQAAAACVPAAWLSRRFVKLKSAVEGERAQAEADCGRHSPREPPAAAAEANSAAQSVTAIRLAGLRRAAAAAAAPPHSAWTSVGLEISLTASLSRIERCLQSGLSLPTAAADSPHAAHHACDSSTCGRLLHGLLLAFTRSRASGRCRPRAAHGGGKDGAAADPGRGHHRHCAELTSQTLCLPIPCRCTAASCTPSSLRCRRHHTTTSVAV